MNYEISNEKVFDFSSQTIVEKPTWIFLKESGSTVCQIPLTMDNTDCVTFVVDWKAGATVTNADGSPALYSDDAVRTLGLTPLG